MEQVTRASKQPNFTTIETAPSSWVDDYVDWLMPGSDCCRYFANDGTEPPHSAGDFCPASFPNQLIGPNRCVNCVPFDADEPTEARFELKYSLYHRNT